MFSFIITEAFCFSLPKIESLIKRLSPRHVQSPTRGPITARGQVSHGAQLRVLSCIIYGSLGLRN